MHSKLYYPSPITGSLTQSTVYTLLNLVSSYHDTLLSKRLNPTLSLPPHPFSNPKQTKPPRITPSIPPSSGHSRYTRFWTRQSRMYRRASRALVTIGYIQLLVEMVSRRKGGDRVRWRVVVLLETIKSAFALLNLSIGWVKEGVADGC